MSKRLELFDKLIANGSVDPFHFYGRAMELRSLGRSAEALTAFMQLIERAPNYVPSYLMAAQLAQAASKLDEAKKACEDGIAAAKREGNEHALSELAALLQTL